MKFKISKFQPSREIFSFKALLKLQLFQGLVFADSG
jgi:hypothetical protein